MTLRRKNLLITCGGLSGLVAAVYLTSSVFLLGSYAALEEQNTRRDVERALNALDDTLAQLDTIAHDWAAWDDSYAFIEDANEGYRQSNLVDNAFVDLRLSFISYLDRSGHVVYEQAFDLENEQRVSSPPDIRPYLSADTPLLEHADTESSRKAIICLSAGPMRVASRPIVTSDDEGPIRGTLVMGRWLDHTEVQRLAELTGLSLTVRPFDEPASPADFQEARTALADHAVHVSQLGEESVAGYALLRDLNGDPALVLRVDAPRLIYQRGVASIRYFLTALLAAGAALVAVTLVLLERWVWSRLERLTRGVSSVGAGGDLSMRIPADGNDELASLTGEINWMLQGLERAQLEREREEKRFRSYFELPLVGIAITSPTKGWAEVNDKLCEILGYSREELLAKTWAELTHPEDLAANLAHFERVIAGETDGYSLDKRFIRKDGSTIHASVSFRCVRRSDGAVDYFLSLVEDITERKQAEQALRESEERFRAIADYTCNWENWIGPDGRLLWINPAVERITGYSVEQCLDMPGYPLPLVHEEDRPRVRQALEAALHGESGHDVQFRVRHRNGSIIWIAVSWQPIFSAQGASLGYRSSMRDVTERKQSEEKLKDFAARLKAANLELRVQKEQLKAQQQDLLSQNEQMEELTRQLGETNAELTLLTRIDPLTHLLNRRAWQESAQYQHEQLLRYGHGYSILMVDVDHFKRFNDSRGHQAGDKCLTQIAQSIVAACRATDFVGRYGGEEFVVLAPETGPEAATALAKRIRQAVWDLNTAHPASPVADRVTVCVGVAASGPKPWEDTVKQADDALYAAKNAGRNRVRLAEPEPGRGSTAEAAEAAHPPPDGQDAGDLSAARIERFAEALPGQVAAIQHALAQRDYQMLAALARQLKEAASDCGSQPFAELAARVQHAADTAPEFNKLTTQVHELVTLCRRRLTIRSIL